MAKAAKAQAKLVKSVHAQLKSNSCAFFERERERLRHENGDLRSILKQYLDGISVNEDVINNANPLLVVNHKTNIVMPSGRRPVASTIVEGAHAVMIPQLTNGRQGATI